MIVDERTLQRLAANTRFSDIRQFDLIDSTNRYLLDEARAGAADGTVAVAAYQTDGRAARVGPAPTGRASPRSPPPGHRRVVAGRGMGLRGGRRLPAEGEVAERSGG
jgi:hypothetical protein